VTHELREGDYTASDDPVRIDVAYVHGWLTKSYWSAGIPRQTVERAIANSNCVGIYDSTGQQCVFARAITDRATYAYIADVFVDEAHRGHGLGKLLIRVLLSHPELQGLRRRQLATRDAQGLYRQFGFETVSHPERHMEILDPDIYKRLD
jgi:ribosomal protein S18 acetylase RimI-like enzyme